jgi:hypothetical protein
LEACVVQEFPDGTCRATVCAAKQEQLQRALIHPGKQHRRTASATIEELNARKGEAITTFHIDAVVRDSRWRLCHAV